MGSLLALALVCGIANPSFLIRESRIAHHESERQPQQPGSTGQVIDELAAVVGGQPITLSDVNAALAFQLVDVPASAPDRRQAALQKLIDRALILVEVDRYQPPEPEPVEITIRIDALQQRAGSGAAFGRQLDQAGVTRDQLRSFIRNDLRIQTYLNQRFGDSPQRPAAIAAWIGELRGRAEVTVLYR
ncbi:MAG TPA: hypothetical protein VGL62_06330 [Vicinamibacterales bacterium]|jgi:hypothetical protein